MKYKAIQNGHIPGIGLIVKGDENIEYNGPPRGFLVPMDEPEPIPEETIRKEVIADLQEKKIPFFRGASTEQLQVILMGHKAMKQAA